MKHKNETSTPPVSPYLITRTLMPENQETPLNFLLNDNTPPSYFYRRNHFPYPKLTKQSFFLPITGEVYKPRIFSFQQLLSFPSRTVKVLLECAGNKRQLFIPKVFGEQWGAGAMSQGDWKGVPLKDLLQYAGLKYTAKEIVFEGYDWGLMPGISTPLYYARSLPIEKALHPDTIIAYEFNGKPIPFKHGYPLRLIVPQWYAMASVKWIKRIKVIDHTFKGQFQTEDYVYYPNEDSDEGKKPVTIIHVNSMIQQPLNLSILNQGIHKIKGMAWSGYGEITRVDVSTDHGQSWTEATLNASSRSPYTWTNWTIDWQAETKGEFTIMSRATDSCGYVQPIASQWNRKGYGYHAIDKVNVKIQ
ncbi:sulfite oxidase [Scopulibacillus cellulosilyticus]|uniref:Sulfite oxidase n=1 Tax=Scopulibacillus cellulosilyticus TaxID=2665665 RepID=A0ABW2PU00_9BACL